MKPRWIVAILVLATIAVSLLLYARKPLFLEQFDASLQDSFYRLRGPLPGDDRIAIVAIDKKAIQAVGKWPWPREETARLVDAVAAARPAVIALDFLFAEEAGTNSAGDRRLADSLRAAGNVILPYLFFLSRDEARHQSQESLERGLEAVASSRYHQVIRGGSASPQKSVFRASGIEAPAGVFARAGRGSGFFNVIPEADGSLRYAPLVIFAQDRPYQSVAVAAVKGYLRLRDTGVFVYDERIGGIVIGKRHIATDQRGCLAVNFYGPAPVFHTVSAADLLSGAPEAAASLAGKIVLVGGTSLGDFETRSIPGAPVAYSVEIQANAVDNILNGTYLREHFVSLYFSLAGILLPAIFLGWFIPRQRKASVGLAILPLVLFCLLAAGYLFFTRLLIKTTVAYGLFSTVCAYLLVSLHRFVAFERQGAMLALAINNVSRTLSSILDLEEILPRILSAVTGFIGAERGALFLLERPEGGGDRELSIKATVNMPMGAIRGEGFAASKALLRESIQREETVLVSRRRTLPWHKGRGPGTVLCLPLTHKNRIFGVVYAERMARSKAMLERFMPILNSFAVQAAIAVENARLYAHLVKREEHLQAENLQLKSRVEGVQRFPLLIGTSGALQRVCDLIEKAIVADVTVLILGETGTGKEVIAQTIHSLGGRKERRFIAQNCAAFPEALLESELFGHVRGAFTGAVAEKKGLFEIADGGTLFLDEVGDLTPGVQAKLLRVLESGVIRPVGGTRERRVDVRIISATNKDLAAEVKAKRFREDLFYRLNAFPIVLPPLRERRGDIPLLAEHFLDLQRKKLGKEIEGFSPAVMDALGAYDFPGNIRELENEIERLAVLVRPGGALSEDLLSEKIGSSRSPRGPAFQIEQGMSLSAFLDAAERSYLKELLRQCGGNKTEAARRIGISRVAFHKKLKRLGTG
jgi:Nif-specific regulatory protein